MPCLVIGNSDDDGITPSHTKNLFDSISHSNKQLEWIEGANHYYFGQPEKSNESANTCRRWLGEKRIDLMDNIVINEVGPRDGLQNINKVLSVDERLMLIRSLEDAGIEHIEIGSFVSDKAVPTMTNTGGLINKLENIDNYSVLIPNKKDLMKLKYIE